MTILDAITSSPINVFFTIVIGIGLAYLYYRKPSSSSSTSSSSTSNAQFSAGIIRHSHNRAFLHNLSTGTRTGSIGNLDIGGTVDQELQAALAQIERQERDMIRQEQDEAYQKSLMADREKRLKKEEQDREKEAKEKAERDRKERLERLHQRLTNLKGEISEKLPFNKTTNRSAASDDIVKLVFKLPDGTRVKQDFLKQDKVKYLHWFVFSLKNSPLQFRMTTNFPKRDLPGRPPLPEDFESIQISSTSHLETPTSSPTTSNNGTASVEPNCELTLAEAGLTETQIIFVYDLEA